MITQRDIQAMTPSELAALAARAPYGFTPVFWGNGTFAFVADWTLERMGVAERAKLTIVSRAH